MLHKTYRCVVFFITLLRNPSYTRKYFHYEISTVSILLLRETNHDLHLCITDKNKNFVKGIYLSKLTDHTSFTIG
jgi:hypothetical protein